MEKISTILHLISSSDKNLNSLLELKIFLNYPDNPESIVIQAINAVFCVFGKFMKDGRIIDAAKNENSPSSIVSSWITGNYKEIICILLDLIDDRKGTQRISLAATKALMDFLKTESMIMMKQEQHYAFNNDLFSRIMDRLLHLDPHLVITFNEMYLDKYDDLRFYGYKNISGFAMKESTRAESNVIRNVFTLLSEMDIEPDAPDDMKFFIQEPEFAPSGNVIDLKYHQKVFSKAWLDFLSFPFSMMMFKDILVILLDFILSRLQIPIFGIKKTSLRLFIGHFVRTYHLREFPF
jgi:hypothetical protein